MHLCTEVDLEVLCIVKDVEEGTALVKLGDAEERRSTVSHTVIPWEQMWLTEWMKPFTGLMTSSITTLLWNKRLLVTAYARPLHQNINLSRTCQQQYIFLIYTLCSMSMSTSCSSDVQEKSRKLANCKEKRSFENCQMKWVLILAQKVVKLQFNN